MVMVSEQPTKKVLRELRDAGFAPARSAGSHTMWKHPSGVRVTVPDGRRKISPGVYRKVLKALKEAENR